MKKKILMLIGFGLAFNSIVNAAAIRPHFKISIVGDDCTVTKTGSATYKGVDGDKNFYIITVTSSCTQSASTCEEAAANASSCANLKAKWRAMNLILCNPDVIGNNVDTHNRLPIVIDPDLVFSFEQ